MTSLAEKLLAVHHALAEADIAHAFGGAIALAYCTQDPRGTTDLDVNILLEPVEAGRVIAALPDGVVARSKDVHAAVRDGQVRIRWDGTPIDLFFAGHIYQAELGNEVQLVPFEGIQIPVVGCTELTVFKALYARSQDWVDIENMARAHTIDEERAIRAMEGFVDQFDARLARLREILATP